MILFEAAAVESGRSVRRPRDLERARENITGEKAENVVEEAYCSTLLCLLANQAMDEKRIITFPEEYKIPYMKF